MAAKFKKKSYAGIINIVKFKKQMHTSFVRHSNNLATNKVLFMELTSKKPTLYRYNTLRTKMVIGLCRIVNYNNGRHI